MKIHDVIKKSQDDVRLTHEELVFLLDFPPNSPESFAVMGESNRISRELSDGKAEVHAQLALNLAPCPGNCVFCSFAQRNGVFTEETRLSVDEAISYARQFEIDGANAVFIMTTAKYPFDLFIEISQEIRRNLDPGTTLIANVGDQTLENAIRLKDAGYTGVYHALRMREGIDTALDPENRKRSIRNFQEAGLNVGTCVEPVGPEHTNDEIADLIEFTASIEPSYSGAARRIIIPGTSLEDLGMINELRMSQIVAVTRLGMPRTVTGNCTHEPCTLGALAGANLFWAEVGANPRDIEARTEEGRGETVEDCRGMFKEADWSIWEGASRYYGGNGG